MDALDLKLGIYDDPERQVQDYYSIDLYRNNLAIFGSAMSGKTTLLKTILIRIHQVCGLTDQEEIYILDFGNNLGKYKGLPYVVACFDATNEENIRRVFKTIEDRLAENIRKLEGVQYLQCAENRPAHVTFILDGLNAFWGEERYTAYRDLLQRIARDGLSKGISVVFAANETSGGVHKLMPSFKRVIALDLPKDDYIDVFSHKVEKPMSRKGRGMANTEKGIYEFQAFYPDKPTATDPDNEAIRRVLCGFKQFCSQSVEGGISKELADSNMEKLKTAFGKKMKSFTETLSKNDWGKYTGTPWDEVGTELLAGLDYYTLEPIRINLKETRSIAIYGKKSFGKSNLLSLILEKALNIPEVQIVIVEDARRAVEDPIKAPAVARVLERAPEGSVIYLHDLKEFEKHLHSQGYYDLPETMGIKKMAMPACGDDVEEPQEQREDFHFQPHPFTVFVIQSRLFYMTAPGGDDVQLISRLDRFVSTETDENKKLFVFSDVQRITDGFCQVMFNNWIDHAFLLDDVLRFVRGQGQRSVFGTQEQDELKERFGKCELGDGFYLNLELVELTKLKFIKQEG